MINKLFNDSITSRYYTLELNIKSKSNSYYDSYLDLLEETIKSFLDEHNIQYDLTRTCGHIIKVNEVKDFFLNTVKINEDTFYKIPDYIKKCNDHKHKKEKCLTIDSIINQMSLYFSFINDYAKYKNTSLYEFDSNYYASIFGETERLNKEHKEEVSKLIQELEESYKSNKLSAEDVEKYKKLVSLKEIELLNIDEQNKELLNQISILKDIKLSSMEHKLNQTIDLLNDIKDYMCENRILSRRASALIDGKVITDEELTEERIKMENRLNGKQ